MLKRLTMAGALVLGLGAVTAFADPAKVMIPANPGGGLRRAHPVQTRNRQIHVLEDRA